VEKEKKKWNRCLPKRKRRAKERMNLVLKENELDR
jgi:hypothetical protein